MDQKRTNIPDQILWFFGGFENRLWESSNQGVSLESLLQLTWDHNPSKSSLSINLWICVIMSFKKLYYRTWHSRWIRGPGEGPMSWAMSSKDQRKRRSWSWEPKYMAFGIIRFVFWQCGKPKYQCTIYKSLQIITSCPRPGRSGEDDTDLPSCQPVRQDW